MDLETRLLPVLVFWLPAVFSSGCGGWGGPLSLRRARLPGAGSTTGPAFPLWPQLIKNLVIESLHSRRKKQTLLDEF